MANQKINRKKSIVYAAEPAVCAIIRKWQDWMLIERNCSHHTLDAYSRDVSAFLIYLTEHLGFQPGINEIEGLTNIDFRGYLAMRHNSGLSHTSNARAISTLKSLYKFMDRNEILHNAAIKIIRKPIQRKI